MIFKRSQYNTLDVTSTLGGLTDEFLGYGSRMSLGVEPNTRVLHRVEQLEVGYLIAAYLIWSLQQATTTQCLIA